MTEVKVDAGLEGVAVVHWTSIQEVGRLGRMCLRRGYSLEYGGRRVALYVGER